MNPGLMVKLRPTGPWRIGPDSGARNQVDLIYHSDSLYAAITAAMDRLGWLEDWLAATARNGSSAVCCSSCFPFVEEIGFVIPPRTIWPPSSPALLSARVRWKSAHFVPLGIVPALISGQTLDENQWAVDGASGCLVPAGRGGPFRMGLRSNSAVDRLAGNAERHSTACLEFRAGAGLWALVSFRDEAARARWLDPLKTAFRLLADTGFGGERSRGWGRSEAPEFIEGVLPDMILGPRERGPASENQAPAAEAAETDAGDEERPDPEGTPVAAQPHWLLSLFTPAPTDQVDWDRGNYAVVERGGRIESPARFGELKKELPMITEGSVLYAAAGLRGCAPDVAPDGFAHPVFRAGFAVSVPLPEAG
jgi:CRISPR type III-A-associated RAMP protein Csm4